MTVGATIIRGDTRNLPLPDASVDLIVTSPPYWSLRSYTDGGEHYTSQIGAEATPREYIAALLECTHEWMRVLKPTGSIWVNLGDKYNAYNGGRGQGTIQRNEIRQTPPRGNGLDVKDVAAKSLLMLPERYRIAAVDELGLVARAVVVWSKPNGLPESVTDRVRRSHEDWVHLTKQPRYYSAVDEIRQPHNSKPSDKGTNCLAGQRSLKPAGPNSGAYNPLGALPGSVWEIATEPLRVPAELGIDHFAAFPTEWPRRIILGWSPSGICTACGEGRRPVVDKPGLLGGNNNPESRNGTRRRSTMDGGSAEWAQRVALPDRIVGEACACPDTTAPTRPAVVLDPFGGTGTTALVASTLGRHGVSVDRSADYCRLAQWRTADPGQRAKAARVPAPPKQSNGQDALFDLVGAA